MEKITDFLITNEHGELISIDKLIELYEIYQNKSKLETFILIPKMLLTNNINNVVILSEKDRLCSFVKKIIIQSYINR